MEGFAIHYDVALLVMESMVEFSQYIRTVCLPTLDQIFDGKENVVSGFGVNEIWYQIYENLTNKVIPKAQLISKDIRLDKTKLLEALSDKDYQKQIIDDFFKSFFEVFPKMSDCFNKETYAIICEFSSAEEIYIKKQIQDKILEVSEMSPDVQFFLGKNM